HRRRTGSLATNHCWFESRRATNHHERRRTCSDSHACIVEDVALQGGQRQGYVALDGSRFRCAPCGLPGLHGMSDLLLDTQAMLWFFWDDPLLSSTAKSVIENPDNRKL